MNILPVGSSPIQSVLLVRRYRHARRDYQFQATSLPGHLIHLVLSGRVRQQCNGRQYELHPGNVIWYHEDEWVTGAVLHAPWEFYSVNFIAPCLPPPNFESRLFPSADSELRRQFQRLYAVWHEAGAAREFRVHAALLEILARLGHPSARAVPVDPRAQLWWEIETRARQQLHTPIALPVMQQWTHRSAATIARSCRYAVGLSPLQRLMHVRMSLARGLVCGSQLAMKEIAGRVGYARVHEFSRSYHRHFGIAPTADRRHTPLAP